MKFKTLIVWIPLTCLYILVFGCSKESDALSKEVAAAQAEGAMVRQSMDFFQRCIAADQASLQSSEYPEYVRYRIDMYQRAALALEETLSGGSSLPDVVPMAVLSSVVFSEPEDFAVMSIVWLESTDERIDGLRIKRGEQVLVEITENELANRGQSLRGTPMSPGLMQSRSLFLLGPAAKKPEDTGRRPVIETDAELADGDVLEVFRSDGQSSAVRIWLDRPSAEGGKGQAETGPSPHSD